MACSWARLIWRKTCMSKQFKLDPEPSKTMTSPCRSQSPNLSKLYHAPFVGIKRSVEACLFIHLIEMKSPLPVGRDYEPSLWNTLPTSLAPSLQKHKAEASPSWHQMKSDLYRQRGSRCAWHSSSEKAESIVISLQCPRSEQMGKINSSSLGRSVSLQAITVITTDGQCYSSISGSRGEDDLLNTTFLAWRAG